MRCIVCEVVVGMAISVKIVSTIQLCHIGGLVASRGRGRSLAHMNCGFLKKGGLYVEK